MTVKKPSEKKIKFSAVWLIIFLLVLSPLLNAESDDSDDTFSELEAESNNIIDSPQLTDTQPDEPPETFLPRRITWRGDEYALYYAVEIDRERSGNFLEFLREQTETPLIDISVPPGEYRFRIVPFDILERPAERTPWMRFEVHQEIVAENTGRIEQLQVINIDDYNFISYQDTPTGLTYKLIEDEGTYSIQIGTVSDTEIIIPAVYNDIPVTRIAYEGFYVPPFVRSHNFDSTSVTNVWIPFSVTTIGHGAFFDWSGLISIWIPNSVTSIGHSAFSGCSSLTNIIIPASVTHISDWAFNACSGITSIVVASGNPEFRSEGNCLIQRSSNTLILGCSTSEIPNSVTRIGNTAFTGNNELKSIIIPDSVISIGEASFSACRNLTEVEIPDSVTHIGSVAFAFCTSLRSITIPESVTHIGNQAFFGCSSLNNVTLGTISPDSFLSDQSFPGNLRSIYFSDRGGPGTYTTRNPGENARWRKQ